MISETRLVLKFLFRCFSSYIECERSSLSAHRRREKIVVTRVRYLQLFPVFFLIPWFMSLSDVDDARHLHAVHPLLFFVSGRTLMRASIRCVKPVLRGFLILCIRRLLRFGGCCWCQCGNTGARGCWERGTCHRQPANAKSLARLRFPVRALLRTNDTKKRGKDLLHF